MNRPVFLLVLAALLPFSACDSGKPETRIDDILRTSLGNRKERVAELAKDAGVEGLKPIVLNPEESMRRRLVAISALGTLRGDKEATKLLVQLANGDDAEIAYWAIIALGTQRAPEGAEQIKKFIEHPNPHLRAAACFAIYEYGDKALYPLLEEAASDQSEEVKRSANLMLGWIANGRPVERTPESPF